MYKSILIIINNECVGSIRTIEINDEKTELLELRSFGKIYGLQLLKSKFLEIPEKFDIQIKVNEVPIRTIKEAKINFYSCSINDLWWEIDECTFDTFGLTKSEYYPKNLKLFKVASFDENFPEDTVAYVLIAASELEARQMAYENDVESNPTIHKSLKNLWMNLATCEEIKFDKSQILNVYRKI